MRDYWREQRSDRVTDEQRLPFSVAAIDTESPEGGFLHSRGRFLMTHEAETVLDLGNQTPPDTPNFPSPLDPVHYTDVSVEGSPLYRLGIREYEYSGAEDLPGHVAELQCRARARARSRGPALAPIAADRCVVALHYVLTGEIGWIPKGNPDTPPEEVAAVRALKWGVGAPEIAIVDTGLDIYSTVTGEYALSDAAAPTRPEGSVLYVDKELDVDLLRAELPGGGRSDSLAAQAGHGTFVTWVAERMSGENTRIVNVRALDPDGVGTEGMLVAALSRLLEAHPGIAVINMSLGGYSDPTDYAALGPQFADASPPNTIPLGIGAWLDANSDLPQQPLLVAAAGNNGIAGREFWPAADGRVVAVGSINTNQKRSKFSNSGPWVDVWSLGEGIVGDYPQGDFEVAAGSPVHLNGGARWSGTSFAAPVVVGEIVRRRHVAPPPGKPAPSPVEAWADFRIELEAAGLLGPDDQGVLWDPRSSDPTRDPTQL
jgi:hypothetical protein